MSQLVTPFELVCSECNEIIGFSEKKEEGVLCSDCFELIIIKQGKQNVGI
jgi:DNA-directed RNA polymerase subunit RPC12/RpoP